MEMPSGMKGNEICFAHCKFRCVCVCVHTHACAWLWCYLHDVSRTTL